MLRDGTDEIINMKISRKNFHKKQEIEILKRINNRSEMGHYFGRVGIEKRRTRGRGEGVLKIRIYYI